MTRLTWGDSGTHIFETGIDRGVLYAPGASGGVPWIGLTAINEKPIGGEPQPYYLDGIKYLQIANAEEYEATLEAFAAPYEFGPCDGTTNLYNGLFITQQPRQQFGLSYRTLIGNDIQSTDYGYKIHIIYNALAKPSERNNTTLADTTDPLALSWDISTVPPAFTSAKPTAHLIIDTSKTDPSLVQRIEDILYGTDYQSAYLPTPDQLITLYQGGVTNLLLNPSFETLDGGMAIVKTNYATRAMLSSPGSDQYWSTYGSSPFPTTAIDTTIYHSAPSSMKVTTTGKIGEGVYQPVFVLNPLPADAAGGYISTRVWIKAPIGATLRVSLRSNGSGNPDVNVDHTFTTSDWEAVKITAPLGAEPSSSIYILTTTTTALVFYVDDIMIPLSQFVGDMVEGSMAADADYTYGYLGNPNTTGSNKIGQTILGVQPFNANVSATKSSYWSSDGDTSAMLDGNVGYSAAYGAILETASALQSGVTYTILGTCHVDSTIAMPATDIFARTLYVMDDDGIRCSSQAPGIFGDWNIRYTFVAGDNAAVLMGGDTEPVWWDDMCLVEGTYSGPAFNGDSPGAVWDGTPHNSTSHLVGIYD